MDELFCALRMFIASDRKRRTSTYKYVYSVLWIIEWLSETPLATCVASFTVRGEDNWGPGLGTFTNLLDD